MCGSLMTVLEASSASIALARDSHSEDMGGSDEGPPAPPFVLEELARQAPGYHDHDGAPEARRSSRGLVDSWTTYGRERCWNWKERSLDERRGRRHFRSYVGERTVWKPRNHVRPMTQSDLGSEDTARAEVADGEGRD